VQTTELDWPVQARQDGWELWTGQWRHEARAESYDDGDWVYLGNGVWEDAYIASLPADTRRDLLRRYVDTLTNAVDAPRLHGAPDRPREQDRER
jgi:hypothetical protein